MRRFLCSRSSRWKGQRARQRAWQRQRPGLDMTFGLSMAVVCLANAAICQCYNICFLVPYGNITCEPAVSSVTSPCELISFERSSKVHMHEQVASCPVVCWAKLAALVY